MAQTIIAGHAFVQNPRRVHYELGIDAPLDLRVAVAFTELALAIRASPDPELSHPATEERISASVDQPGVR